jgi:hypothetical protein
LKNGNQKLSPLAVAPCEECRAATLNAIEYVALLRRAGAKRSSEGSSASCSKRRTHMIDCRIALAALPALAVPTQAQAAPSITEKEFFDWFFAEPRPYTIVKGTDVSGIVRAIVYLQRRRDRQRKNLEITPPEMWAQGALEEVESDIRA